ncbi:MarR family winged helix-turn-helix transcriptional regulator [Sphingobacterium mizutaii]|uniref:MarR family winged helix-turn-helix transcriptional regulator n=1 Tax=Sphingobacterium mizutaii TaxID=1010 RepID=UPI0028AE1203|nr:MarR family transcriptional regulator [Sphingobacterium mizutaii]
MTDQLKLTNQGCFPVYALAKEIVNHYRPYLEKLDLTYPQYLVMLVLWEENEQTVTQLGEKLKLDSGTLIAAFGVLPALIGAGLQEVVDLISITSALRALKDRT